MTHYFFTVMPLFVVFFWLILFLPFSRISPATAVKSRLLPSSLPKPDRKNRIKATTDSARVDASLI
ncbi:MAG: hypothetical protein GXX03_01610 [Bacteroidales bacterium]|nr:hypothetical protein [Bacteroidales bacterium]